MVKLHYSNIGWTDDIAEFNVVIRPENILEAISVRLVDDGNDDKNLLVGTTGQATPLTRIMISGEFSDYAFFFRVRTINLPDWTGFYGLGDVCSIDSEDRIVGFQYFTVRASEDYVQKVRKADEILKSYLVPDKGLESKDSSDEESEALDISEEFGSDTVTNTNTEVNTSIEVNDNGSMISSCTDSSVNCNVSDPDNSDSVHQEISTEPKFEGPLVSVLVPSYNHGKYIADTINSIINQTYRNIELLILDDGSSDDTAIKVNDLRLKCASRFSRFLFQMKPNEGVCLTLNKLINESRGEYIFLIASDDMAKPTLIEKEVNFLEVPANSAYSLAVCDNAIIDQDGVECFWGKGRCCVYHKEEAEFLTFGHYIQTSKGIDFKGPDFGKYDLLYRGNHIPNGYLIRKSILDITGLYNPEAPLEDYYLMLQLSKYSLFKYIDEPLFCYRWHDSNTIKEYNKIAKMTAVTRKVEDGVLAKINIAEPALLRNVLLFKYRHDLNLSLSNPQQIIGADYSNDDFNLEKYDLLQTYFNISIPPKNFGYNAFLFRSLNLKKNSSYLIMLKDFKISEGQDCFDFGVYDTDTDSLLYAINVKISPDNCYKILISLGGFSRNLNFCIYAGVHAKTNRISVSINEISVYAKPFNE